MHACLKVFLFFSVTCQGPALTQFFFFKPNGTHLFWFVDQDTYPTWCDHLESMEKEGTWGDNLILQAAANYYTCRTPIRVISSLGQDNELLISPDSQDYVVATISFKKG